MATKLKAVDVQEPPENLAIWNALSRTDPAHTKSFSRAGGFKGTAIKPIWIVRRLTEQFGPVGKGWGMGHPRFEVVRGADEVLVYCTVECWHTDMDNTFVGVGGDKVVTKRNDGKLFHDDEAFKKAFTDAVGNAFKFLGVGADVHMGLFEDSKYLAEVREEFADTKADGDASGTVDDNQWAALTQLIEASGANTRRFCEYFGVESVKMIPAARYEDAIKALQDKAKKGGGK